MPKINNMRIIALLAAMLFSMANANALQAHVDIDKPERLVKVEGLVVNTQGNPVSGAPITLERDGKVIHQVMTDSSGRFKFGQVHGDYLFHVGRTQYSPAVLSVTVGDDLVVVVERKKLYVIAGPGACEDECSTVTTDKIEFKKILKQKQQIAAQGTKR
jgi:hypothetical protein